MKNGPSAFTTTASQHLYRSCFVSSNLKEQDNNIIYLLLLFRFIIANIIQTNWSPMVPNPDPKQY